MRVTGYSLSVGGIAASRASLFLAACFPLLPSAHAAEKVTYDDHIFPIFEATCLNCHNPDKKKGDLDLSNYTGTMAGGSGGSIANAGDGSSSKLYACITHTAEPFMPPKGDKLEKKDTDLIRAWIDGGLLENMNSAARKPSGPRIATLDVDPSAKPDGPPPMPEHLSLEPVVVAKRGTVINDMACSPWAPLLAITGQHQVLLYNTDTLRLAAVIPFPRGFPETVSFHPTGKYLMAGGGIAGKSGTTYTWEVSTGALIMENGKEFDSILASSLRLDLGGVAFGGPSRLIKLWDTQTGEQLKSIKKHTDWVTDLAYSPDGVLLATGDRNGGVWVWEAQTGNEFHTLREHQKAITAISWRADSNLLATASEDGQVAFWEMNNGGQVKKFAAHGGGTLSFDYARNGEFVTSGRDNKVKIWKADFNLKQELPTFSEMVVEVAITSDGGRVFTADWNGKIEAWDANTFAKLGELSSNPPHLADRIAALTQSIAAAPQATAAAKATLDTAAKTVADAKDALQKTIADRDATKQLIAVLQAEKPTIEPEFNRLNEEHGKLTAARGARENELKEAEARIAAHKVAIASAEAEVKSLDLGPATAEEQNLAAEGKRLRDDSTAKPEDAGLKQQAEAAEQALAAHRTKLADLRGQLAGREARFQDLTARLPEIVSMEGPARKALTEANAALQIIEAERTKVTDRRSKIDPELQAANTRLGQFESAIKPAEENVAAKEKAVEGPKAEFDQAAAHEAALQADLKFWEAAAVNAQALALLEQHKQLKGAQDADLASRDALTKQVAQWQEELKTVTEEPKTSELNNKIAAAQKELAALVPAIDQRAPEVAKLEQEAIDLQARYLELRK